MPQLAETLGTIEQWPRESYNISIVSDDSLVPVIARAFEAMSFVLKAPGKRQIQRALESLESERSISLRHEKPEDSSIRSLMYAVVDCLQQTLFHVTENRNEKKPSEELSTQTDQVSNRAIGASIVLSNENSLTIPVESQDSPYTFPNLLLKEEPFDISQLIPGDHQMPPLDFMGDEMESVRQEDMTDYDMNAGMDDTSLNLKEEDMMDTFSGGVDPSFNEDNTLKDVSSNVEDVNETALSEIHGKVLDNYMTDDFMEREDENKDVHGVDDMMEREERAEVINKKDSSEAVEIKKGRRSSRVVSRHQQYKESLEDSDGDDEPVKKNPKSDPGITRAKNRKLSAKESSQSESAKSVRQGTRLNDTALECPECEYRSNSVIAWVNHMRSIHSTSPVLAGLALRCDCGKECVSEWHMLTCNIANFTIIRKRDGPIRRLDDEKVTPQCIMCEMYPKTACGYIHHLHNHHKTTLTTKGFYLMCECDSKVTCNNSLRNHNKECDGRIFTLHKRGDH